LKIVKRRRRVLILRKVRTLFILLKHRLTFIFEEITKEITKEMDIKEIKLILNKKINQNISKLKQLEKKSQKLKLLFLI